MRYNLEKLEELSGGDREFIVSVVSVFAEETPSDLEELEQAVKSGNFDAIYQHAHKIKPNVDLLGMEETTERIVRMETWAREKKDLQAIEVLYAEVKENVQSAIVQLRTDLEL